MITKVVGDDKKCATCMLLVPEKMTLIGDDRRYKCPLNPEYPGSHGWYVDSTIDCDKHQSHPTSEIPVKCSGCQNSTGEVEMRKGCCGRESYPVRACSADNGIMHRINPDRYCSGFIAIRMSSH